MSTLLTPKFKVKDPSAILVYDMDWGTNWLAVGVTIVTSTWTLTEETPLTAWSALTAYVVGDLATSVGILYRCIVANTNQLPPNATYWVVVSTFTALTKDQESTLVGGRSTRLRLTGGTPGLRYLVTNRILTNETPAQTDERTFELLIENR